MKIVTVPNVILTIKAKPVLVIDKRIKKLVADMKATLVAQTDPEGVGLAAPQVGQALRIFIMRPTKKAKMTVCINPEIITRTKLQVPSEKKVHKPGARNLKRATKLEGCLSIPKIWGHVDRVAQVKIRYQTLSGETKQDSFSSFEALIAQHEVDHLEGILFTKRILEQNGQLYREEAGELKEYKI